jgi:hypothetical protein
MATRPPAHNAPVAPLDAPPPVGPDILAGPTSCPANVRETKIAFGFVPQPDLPTPNTPPEMWSLTKTNPALGVVTPINETDADDIGKGDEFPTATFPTSIDTAATIEKFCSSEFLAWLFCFTTGQATKTGNTYTAVPSDPVVNCLNLPAFTYAEQIRPQPDSVVDRAMVGMVVNDWTLTMESGPGRANCRVAVNCVGTGKTIAPSGITPWPAIEPEHFLNAASATISILGIDYVMSASFISAELRWGNNVRLPSGLYPGSGVQNGYAIRGRMEYGSRECSLRFVARALKGSPEYALLMTPAPGNEGSVTISTTGATIGAGPGKHGFTVTFPRAVFTAVVNGEADGIVTVDCVVTPLKPPTGDYVTLSATTEKSGILGLT